MGRRQDNLDPNALVPAAVEIARDAGERIMEIYGTKFTVRHKEDRTPLTAADMAAHRTILEGLRDLTPTIPILSEESVNIPFHERQDWTVYWLADPLDGTREFVKGNGEFTVNIALVRDHQSVLGVVYAPATGAMYFAARGGGSFKSTAATEPVRIHARPLGHGPIIVADSRSHKSPLLAAFLEALGDHRILSMGSSLKSCLVAEGAADVYPRLGRTSEWDTAAAQCIVEEAGGAITDTDMRPLRYNTKASLENPYFLVVGDPSHDWSQYVPPHEDPERPGGP